MPYAPGNRSRRIEEDDASRRVVPLTITWPINSPSYCGAVKSRKSLLLADVTCCATLTHRSGPIDAEGVRRSNRLPPTTKMRLQLRRQRMLRTPRRSRFPGVAMEWLEARESRSKPDRGVVKLRISLINRTA